jgi:hypothetical protein
MRNKLFFYSNDYLNLIFKQKQTISIIVPKYIIKGKTQKLNMIILTAENYTTIYKVFSKSYKRLKRLRLLKLGRVLYENVYLYKKKYLNFKFIGRENKKNNLCQTKFRKFQMYSSKSTLLYLYKKIKGGYLGFSKGFSGFISRKDFYLSIKNIKFPFFSSFYITKLNLSIQQTILSFKFKKKRKVRKVRRKKHQKKLKQKILFCKIKYIFKATFKNKNFNYFI